MSNEAFDKKIKAKLEQINPVFEEKSWEKFVPLLPPATGGIGFPLGQILTLAGAVVTILYLGYDNYIQGKANNELKSEINLLQNKENKIIEKIITERDTIYITKYINQSNSSANQEIVKNLQEKNKELQAINAATESVINLKNAKIADNQTIINRFVEKENSLKKEIYTPIVAATEFEGVQTGVGKNEKSDNEEKAIQPEAESLKPNPVVEPLPEIAKNRPEKEDKKHYLRSNLGLTNLNFRRLAGFGITSHFKVWNNWGLNIGVDALTRAVGFDDDKDYLRQNKRDFKDNLGGLAPADGGFYKNIESIKQVIALPITVQYTYDLPKQFSIFANAGTSLQLSSREEFEFDLGQRLGQFTPIDYKTKLDARVFSNLTGSIGMQKEWKRLIFQASPTYVFNLAPKRIFEQTLYGIRFSMMYRMYK